MQFRTNIRRIILAGFSINFVNQLQIFLGFGEYILPITAYHIPHPIFNLFGTEISSIWLALMAYLIISVIPNLNSDASLDKRLAIGSLLLVGILGYRLTISVEEIFIFTIVVTLFYSVIWKQAFANNWKKSVEQVSRYTAVVLVFGLTGELIDTFFFLPEIILGLTGIYLFFKWVIGRLQSHPETAGIEDQLYRSSVRLLQSPTGAATACIMYLALFSTTTTVEKYQTPMDFGNLFSLHPYSLAVNLSGTTTLVFYILIYVFWFKLIERAPYSVDYWENGYRKEIHPSLDDRPSYLLIALPTIGWILSRLPALDVAHHGRDVAGEWYLFPLAVYSIFLTGVLVFTGIVWSGQGNLIFEMSFISPDRSIKSDKYLFAAAIIFLLIHHLLISFSAVILLVLASVLLLADGSTGSDSPVPIVLAVLELSVLVIFVPIFLNPTDLAVRFREVLIVFIIVYLFLQVAERLGCNHTNSIQVTKS